MPPGSSVHESSNHGAPPVCARSGGIRVARRTDGAAVQTALLVAGAVLIAALVALALIQWFGRLT